MKKLIMLIMAGLLAFACLACTPAPPATENPAASENPAVTKDPETVETTEPAKNPSDITIAGLAHVESYFGTMVLQGMAAAANKYGVKLVTTNFNGDAAKEVEAINTYVAQKVDGIVSMVSETTLDMYRQASEKGIMISAINSIATDDFLVSAIMYQQADLGRGSVDYAVKFISENLNSIAKVHVVRARKGSIADARSDAFMEGLTKAFGENATVVSESSSYIVAEAMQQVTDALTANPDINIVYCEGEDALMGAYAAIQNANLAGKVFLFGVDGNQQLAEYLLNEKDVILQGTAAQDPYTMAYKGTENLILTILGQRESSHGESEKLKASELNKGDLAAVQKYYDDLKAASTK